MISYKNLNTLLIYCLFHLICYFELDILFNLSFSIEAYVCTELTKLRNSSYKDCLRSTGGKYGCYFLEPSMRFIFTYLNHLKSMQLMQILFKNLALFK